MCVVTQSWQGLSSCEYRICWPFEADQPANSANLTINHNVAYELFEVRTGQGLRPVHRLNDKKPEGTIDAVRREAFGVFTKAQGEDGEEKRKNVQKISEDS